MVDELQDTNARQMALLEALDRDNLFTVGDEFQSIYGFRHADVSLFRERRATLAAAAPRACCRPTSARAPPLLDAVNAVFGRASASASSRSSPGAPTPPRRRPLIELLLADTDGWERTRSGSGVELAPAPLWRRAEARAARAAHRRADRRRRGRAPRTSSCCSRAAASMGVYEAALADLGHATLATAGGGFFARPEVVDLVAYMRALANPLDELALYGVLASPLCGCGADALAALACARASAARSVVGAPARRDPPDARAAAFVARFAAARRAAARRALGKIVAAASPRTATTSTWPRCTRPSGGSRTSASSSGSRATSRRARAATCAASRRARRRAASAAPRDRGAAAGRRHRRDPPDDDPCRQGPRVPGRLPRRPRSPDHAASRACSPTASASALRLPSSSGARRHARLRATSRGAPAAAAAEEERIVYVAMTRAASA